MGLQRVGHNLATFTSLLQAALGQKTLPFPSYWKEQPSMLDIFILYFSIATITSLHIILLLFSCSVMSDSLWPYGLQHSRLPCSSPTPGAYSNSCPLSWWCHPTVSFSAIPFSSCLQSFLASGSFPMRWFFESGGQSIEGSASASILPINIQDWFLLGWTGWISLQSKGFSRVFSNTTVQKHQCFTRQALLSCMLGFDVYLLMKSIFLEKTSSRVHCGLFHKRKQGDRNLEILFRKEQKLFTASWWRRIWSMWSSMWALFV